MEGLEIRPNQIKKWKSPIQIEAFESWWQSGKFGSLSFFGSPANRRIIFDSNRHCYLEKAVFLAASYGLSAPK